MLTCSLLAAAVLHATATAEKPQEGVSLTVYSSADPAGFNPQQFIQQQRMSGQDNIWGVPGYGVIKEVRRVTVPKGMGALSFTDVAAWIDPTTVSFNDLDDAKTTVLEQNFQFDLVSPSKLMEKFLGREISLSVAMGDGVSYVAGTLLSANQGSVVLQTATGVKIVPMSGAQIQLGELPGGLLTKPTLVWKLASESGGEHLVRTTYQTAGMTWRSDYNIVVNGSDTKGDITAWVTLMNLSGASFSNAELKLVAGDVHKIEASRPMPRGMMRGEAIAMADAGVKIVPMSGAQLQLGDLPGGLLTKPTLVWKLASESGGEHLVRTTYQTAGMTWRSDYNIVINGNDTKGDITAWVTLMNLSGASFSNAELKLVAGDVHKIEASRPMPRGMMRGEAIAMADAGGFVEKEFADFHLYTLPRRTDVLQNSTQQIALFPPVSGFKVTRELVFDFTGGMGAPGQPILDRDFVVASKAKPSILVSFENKKENSLGMPLPKGKIRVYKEDPSDGTLEFIGEDLIDHTPRNETVKIRLGEAFDVVGERIRSDFTIDNAAKRMTETFKIELRNQKSAAQKVRVIERPYRWTNWQITKKNTEFEKLDSGTIRFDVDIPSEGARTIEYTVVYTW